MLMLLVASYFSDPFCLVRARFSSVNRHSRHRSILSSHSKYLTNYEALACAIKFFYLLSKYLCFNKLNFLVIALLSNKCYINFTNHIHPITATKDPIKKEVY